MILLQQAAPSGAHQQWSGAVAPPLCIHYTIAAATKCAAFITTCISGSGSESEVREGAVNLESGVEHLMRGGLYPSLIRSSIPSTSKHEPGGHF